VRRAWRLCLLLAALGVSVAADGLSFEREALTQPVPDDVASAEFLFVATNPGPFAITIDGVKPACSCLHAEPGSVVIAPGGRTDLAIGFAPGHLQGSVRRTAVVNWHRDGEAPAQTVISLTAQLSSCYTVSEGVVRWPSGDRTVKDVVFRAVGNQQIIVSLPAQPPAGYELAVEPIEPERSYRLKVRALTDVRRMDRLEVPVTCPVPRLRTAQLYLFAD
jgi:hypothetical protein